MTSGLTMDIPVMKNPYEYFRSINSFTNKVPELLEKKG